MVERRGRVRRLRANCLLPAACCVLIVLAGLLPAAPVVAGSPPDPPVITSPESTDVAPGDVHMEMGAPFHDPDGDAHVATDWEIRTDDGAIVVWAAYASGQADPRSFRRRRLPGAAGRSGSARLRRRSTCSASAIRTAAAPGRPGPSGRS